MTTPARWEARDRKIARRDGKNHPVNGIAMKRLLNERAAKAQAEAAHERGAHDYNESTFADLCGTCHEAAK